MNLNGLEVVLTILLGFGAGILSGLFGIGGGLVIVPALMILFQVPIERAIATSLFALLWPVGLLGVMEYWREGKLNVWQGALIAVGLFLGAYFGARINLSLSRAEMKRLYAVFLLLIGTYYLWTSRPAPEKPVAPDPTTAVPPQAAPDQVH